MTSTQLLAEFFKLQEQRALLYSHLHEQFKSYLDTKLEGPFAQLLRQLTQAFSGVSRSIVDIESRLRSDAQLLELAEHIRAVQNLERDKLRITLTLQTLRKSFADKAFSWQHGDYDPLDSAGHAACSCCDRSFAPQEPTPVEYHAAVKEAMQEHDRIVNEINAELQELRCELQDG